jgi:hypothetical protein
MEDEEKKGFMCVMKIATVSNKSLQHLVCIASSLNNKKRLDKQYKYFNVYKIICTFCTCTVVLNGVLLLFLSICFLDAVVK